MHINKLIESTHTAMVEKGFHQEYTCDYDHEKIASYLLLAIGELSEAYQELRHGHAVNEVYYTFTADGQQKPEGFPVEIADAFIYLSDLVGCFPFGENFEAIIAEKAAFNAKRPIKHGKMF